MIEKLKEVAFTVCAIALACSNLGTFILIAVFGFAPIVYESWAWLLYLEMGLTIGFIIWGIERLIGDLEE